MVFFFQFDPAMQRYLAMRVTHWEHFKPSHKNFLWTFCWIYGPIIGLTYYYITSKVENNIIQCPQKKCSIYKRNRNVHTHIVYNHLFCIQCVIDGQSLISVLWYVHTLSLLPALNPVSYYHAASLERGTNIDLWIFMKNYLFDNFKPP